jgi:predicted membrane-bound mannosyltransferase
VSGTALPVGEQSVTTERVTGRQFALALAGILLVAAVLRTIFPTADPPWRSSVGIVWHDEGGWTHNARNRALYGAWRQDEWNPMYVSPVFTGVEYAAFAACGVGLWQARLAPAACGVLSVLLLGLALRRLYGRAPGLVGAWLLACSYV